MVRLAGAIRTAGDVNDAIKRTASCSRLGRHKLPPHC